jgi:hypothetical protein
MKHGQDARATPPCGMGVPPMKHGQDARATPPCGMGVPPMKHGQDARATPANKEFGENLVWIDGEQRV